MDNQNPCDSGAPRCQWEYHLAGKKIPAPRAGACGGMDHLLRSDDDVAAGRLDLPLRCNIDDAHGRASHVAAEVFTCSRARSATPSEARYSYVDYRIITK